MATLAVTPHSRVADRVMGAYFRLQVDEGTFREDTTPAFSADTLALCEMFGMTPVKLHYAGADRRLQCEAFVVNDPADRRIYLTNHAKSPERALIGHELVHRMRRERPKLYDSLVRALGDAGEAHDRWIAYYTAMREQTQRKEGRALSDDEIREEGVADLVGDLILDPAVWRALQRPTLLQRVADWIGSVWKRLQGAQTPVDPLGGGGLIRDRKRAMAAVARVLGDWADSLARPSPADPDYAPAPANATLRRDPNAPAGAFRSALLDALVAGKGAPVQAPWQQWLGWLDGAQRRGEFRQSERAWLGLDAWMGQRKGPIPRQALVDYLRAHQVLIDEVVLGESDVADVEAWWSDEGGANEDTPWGDLTAAEQAEARDRYRDEVGQYEKQGATTKFASYQLPGGENYRELLLTLPSKADFDASKVEWRKDGESVTIFYDGSKLGGPFKDDGERDAGVVRTLYESREETLKRDGRFHSSHFDQPNILAHVRFNERTDADGKRVLFIEEIQSDWHQDGRKKGYASGNERSIADIDAELSKVQRERSALIDAAAALPDSQMAEFNRMNRQIRQMADRMRELNREWDAAMKADKAVPNAPFKQTDEWAMLAFKRMVRHAAENGFDRIAWTTGEQQAERYDLSKQVDRIDYTKTPSGDIIPEIFQTGGGKVPLPKRVYSPDELAEVVGKEIADRIANDGNDGSSAKMRSLSGDGLKVGGEGMRGFYDKILPSAVNKWAKRFGGKVGSDTLPLQQRWNVYETRDGFRSLIQSFATRNEAEAYRGDGRVEVSQGSVDEATVHAIDLTPAMRDAALQGLPLFRRQASEVGSPEFRHWFCDSKVVDANGDPLVVYHGTKSRAFHTFREGDEGIFFAESESTARFYAGGGGLASASGRIVPAYLSLSNPLRMTWREWLGGVTDGGIQHGLIGTEGLVEHGYDGVILSEPDADDPAANSTTYIVFRPEQIKSAVDNNGAFDPENPDIRFRRNAMLPETIESMKP